MQEKLRLHRYKSPFCEIGIAVLNGRVVSLTLGGSEATSFESLLRYPFVDINTGCADRIFEWLDQYFSGKAPDFSLPLRLYASDFRIRVLKACMQIPFAETRSYAETAAMAGQPKAVRATGTALARNPLPLLIPCHRVIRANGNPGHFSGANGTALKQQLINLEKGLL
jgi:O-6-methylguanine DNA methyltransferase